jgi:hypothetical protein
MRKAAPGYLQMVFEHAFLFWITPEWAPEVCQIFYNLLINWLKLPACYKLSDFAHCVRTPNVSKPDNAPIFKS